MRCAALPKGIRTVQVEPSLLLTSSKLHRSTHSGVFFNGTSSLSLYALPGSEDTPSPADSLDEVQYTVVEVQARGVRINFETGGLVGSFSLRSVILTVTSGLVLSQAAGFAVQVCSPCAGLWLLSIRHDLTVALPLLTMACEIAECVWTDAIIAGYGHVPERPQEHVLLHRAEGGGECGTHLCPLRAPSCLRCHAIWAV